MATLNHIRKYFTFKTGSISEASQTDKQTDRIDGQRAEETCAF
jgi:hypothetical protein